MKLYITPGSPYARLARIVVIEKGLTSRVEIVVAQTRTADSPYYRINPSGRVPYLIDDDGVRTEDSQVICALLDHLDNAPLFHPPGQETDWPGRRLEAMARSLCDGISVWGREYYRPEGERSPGVMAHEAQRARRLADRFEVLVRQPDLMGPPRMAHFVLAAAMDFARVRKLVDLRDGRPNLAAWHGEISARPSLRETLPP